MKDKQEADEVDVLVEAVNGESPDADATTEGDAEERQPQPDDQESAADGEVQDTAGQPAPEAKAVAEDVDIHDLLDDKGVLDLGKVKNLKKSNQHAQKLVGQTAQDREKLKKLPELEDAHRKLAYFEQLAQVNPNILAEVDRARRGGGQSPQAQQPQPEELEKQISEAAARGNWKKVFALTKDADPEIQELRKTKQELAEFKQKQERAAQEAAWTSERRAWRESYKGVVFGEDGESVVDQELHDKILNDTLGRTATYDDATKLAMFELGRVPQKKPASNPAKKQAMEVQPKGRNAHVPKPPRRGVQDEDEAMEGMSNAAILKALESER